MKKFTVEDSWSIDVTHLRHHVLNGWTGIIQSISWGYDQIGGVTADAFYKIIDGDPGHAQLDIYMTAYGHDHHHSFKQQIDMFSSPIPNAARRWWFVCPKCEKRCSKLHLVPDGARFLCRVCNNLAYRSTQGSRRWDSLAKLVSKNTGHDLKGVKHFIYNAEL